MTAPAPPPAVPAPCRSWPSRVADAWFAPAPAARLGLLRFVVGAFLVVNLLARRSEVAGIAATDPAFWKPVGIARLLDGPVPVGVFAVFQDATIGLCALFALGLAWRIVGPLAAAAFWAWATYRLSWGAIAHDLHVVTLHVLALVFTPASAAFSLDAALARRFAGWPTWAPGPVAGSAHYGWPLRLLSTITVLTYALAGYAKIGTKAGIGWARGENLLGQIAYTALVRRVYEPDRPAALWEVVFDHKWVMSAAAGLTLVLELFAPIALLGGWVTRVWIVGILGMHAGIAVLMGITFPYQTYGLALLSFVAIERVLPRRLHGR